MTKHFDGLVLLAAMSCGICHAQDDSAVRLANQVRADARFLAAGGTFGAWRASHRSETANEARYLTEESMAEDKESPFTRKHQKCSVSVGSLPGQVTRAASFYAPRVRAGKLPPLPSQMDRSLAQHCELDELWYIAGDEAPISMTSLFATLESAWGKANGQSEEIGFGASHMWHGIVAWHRDGWNVWIVPNPSYGTRRTLGKVAIALRRSGMPEDSDWLYDTSQQLKAIRQESVPVLAEMAALDPVLSAAIVRRARCATGVSPKIEATVAASQLRKWISASNGLPSARRAAALLLADDYMTCIGGVEVREPFIALGAKFDGGCPQDGGAYGDTFRRQAEKLDPDGLAGAWGQLADLWTFCALEDDRFVGMAGKLLLRFPQWRAYLHYLIGQAHGARLAFAFPGGFPGDTELRPLSAAGKLKERMAAIEAYRSFIEEKPNDPEAVFAWQEAWRLLAGLKPSAVEFGCTCE